jgi:hypothetical protein
MPPISRAIPATISSTMESAGDIVRAALRIEVRF